MRARLLVTLVLLASPAVAMVHPNMERGFDPDAAFQTGQIDNVNLFNGSLTLAIPIGSTYPVNGGFSYGLTLVYSSNIWEFQQVLVEDPDTGELELKTEAFASRFWNAGLGWRLSMGELVDKNDAQKNQTGKWMYVGPDGGAHVFYQDLHETEDDNNDEVLYTRDGSYLRMVVEPGHEQEFNTWKRVEFADGTLHSFRKFSGSWRLEKIQDRFGNFVSIAYVDVTGPDDEWHLTDNWGRQTKVYFQGAANLVPRVDKVILPSFGGGTATWNFSYVDAHRAISDKDDYGGNNDRPLFSLLTRIDLPGGAYYEMLDAGEPAYNDEPCGSADCSGTIQHLRLPTGGRLAWTYQAYQYPNGPYGWVNTTTGVLQRKLIDKNGNDAAKWTYANKRVAPEGEFDEVHTFVTAPAGDSGFGTCTKHYFAAPPELDWVEDWRGWEYGLPFSWRQTQGSGADTRYISTELWTESTVDGEGDRVCSGTKEVSTFLRFAHDKLPTGTDEEDKPDWYNTNRRVQIQTTRYDQDGLRFTKISHSDFDGIGHYRQSVVTGTLEGNPADYPWSPITTVTHYNRSSGVYDIDPVTNSPTLAHTYQVLPTSEDWILGIFDYQTTSDSGVAHGEDSARTDYSFNGATGFLNCVRRRQDPESQTFGAHDALVRYTKDGSGNVIREQTFGGDLQSIPTTPICADTFTTFVSRVDHGYEYGARETSRIYELDGGAQAFPYLSYNATADPSTGLIAIMEDPQGLVTDYDYDAVGRPLSIVHPELADTFYSYTNVTGGAPAKVAIDQRTGAGDNLTRSEVHFDDFGRQVMRRQEMPGGAWSEQETAYDAAGRVKSVSVPGDLTKKTQYLNFDVLNRPTTIRPPDGSSHDVTLTYFGVRRVDTQVKVATSETSETAATRREFYDNAGRLRKVMEPAGDAGAMISTEYRYDAGGHLSWISQNHGGAVNQQRLFTYDNRGFLLKERHPEKGLPTHESGWWVKYSDYDAAGRVGRIEDPENVSQQNVLRFTYDYAGRVTEVSDAFVEPDRLVKEFVYDNDLSTYGKLYQAIRHNYDPSSGGDVTVTESYTYNGTGGAVSQRTTHVSGLNYTFSQGFTWNELGLQTSLIYPTCIVGSCSGLSAGVGTVISTYNHGMLRTVSNWTTGNINYHPNGLLDELPHSNGTTDWQDIEAGSLPRPSQLKTTKGGPVLWDSGTFDYDGAGNIKAMGANKFVYDSVSRLLQGKVGWTPQVDGWIQSYEYDEFGNMLERTTTPPGGSGTPVTFGVNKNRNRLSMATYDNAGNMTDWMGAGSFTYDPVNQLLQLVTNDGTWKYIYTADDERAAAIRIDGGNTGYAFYIRDLNGQLLTHFTRVGPDGLASWTRTRDYVRAGGRLIGSSGTEGVRHYHPDHLGTPRIVTDASGAVWTTHDYLPYGEEVTDPQQNSLALKYTSHERDKHAAGTADDLDYMHARYYGVYLARFSALDPVRGAVGAPQSLNRYAYVIGNPIRNTDPTGRACYSTSNGEYCFVWDSFPGQNDTYYGWSWFGGGDPVDQFLAGLAARRNKPRGLPPGLLRPTPDPTPDPAAPGPEAPVKDDPREDPDKPESSDCPPATGVTAVLGVGGSVVAVTGVEASFGVAASLTTSFPYLDFGLFASGGAGVGLAIGADAFGGFFGGGISGLNGPTVNVNLVAGQGSLSLINSPGGGLNGVTGGVGPSVPLGASVTGSATGAISYGTVLRYVTGLVGLNPPC